jgi:hypothetical protein
VPVTTSAYPAQQCKDASLRISPGSPPSSETGEHAFALVITNLGPVECWVSGYPRIRLVDANGVDLPMTYRHGGGYVTAAAPTQVLVPPRGEATVVFAKYRCDLGDRQVATAIKVALPGSADFASIPTADSWPTADYCGPHDPGDGVDISPITSDVQKAIGWPPAPVLSRTPSANR